jgi:hypothetical protein
MARICTICGHANRTRMEAELISGRSLRTVANTYGVDFQALNRHLRNHLPRTLREAAETAPPGPSILSPVGQGPVPVEPVSEPVLEPIPEPAAAPLHHPSRVIQIDDTPAPVADSLNPVSNSPAASPVLAPAPTPLDLLTLARNLRDRALGILASAESARDGKMALAAIRETRGLLESLSRLEERNGGASGGEPVPLAQSPDWIRARTALLTALQPFPEARIAAAAALMAAGANAS